MIKPKMEKYRGGSLNPLTFNHGWNRADN